MRHLDIFQLQCRLKDIYFPYIQCDEVSKTGKTTMPIEFQVNGINLAEIEAGEVATTNWHSCNGPAFVLHLRFSIVQNNISPSSRECQQANARLRCVYFPIDEGKENIERILEKMEAEGCGIIEKFETFSRVSIRRLGRLLPDARWGKLPFMEPRLKRGDKAQMLKRCSLRVKCFVESDAGFNPTPSKTDLAHQNPYTVALKNFGRPLEKDNDVNVEIRRDGRLLSLLQLEKEYQEWVFQMHDGHDEEIECGEDQPVVLVVEPCKKKELGISSDVIRVHRVIRRKGKSWKSGQKIKILKGAVGCHKKTLYATLEYILLEGCQGDVGGEARLICRPLSLPENSGCSLTVTAENANLDIRGSVSFPVSVIDSGKCQAIDATAWELQLEKLRQKAPSKIDILNGEHCQQLEIDGALPIDSPVFAGHVPPEKIVAVVRPASFPLSSASNGLDPKYIVKDDLEMYMEIKYSIDCNSLHDKQHLYSERVKPSSWKEFHGLFIFPLGCKFPNIFHKAGVYTFSFSVMCKDSSYKKCEVRVIVKPSCEIGAWGLLCDEQSPLYNIRVGSCCPLLSIACYDSYQNRVPFICIPEVTFKIDSNASMLVHTDKIKVDLSSSKMTMHIKDLLIESSELDKLRPYYKASLVICAKDELFFVTVPCQVIPGPLQNIRAPSLKLEKHLLPGDVIEELLIELFDAYDNHVKSGSEIVVNLDGFHFQDHMDLKLKVDDQGFVNLGHLLKVTGGYGKTVSISINSGDLMVFKKEFQVQRRELRTVSRVPGYCPSGSQLKGIVFEIVNSEGVIDEAIHDDEKFGQSHTLSITSETSKINDSIRYTFRRGRCTVPVIPVPHEQGIFSFVAAHSRHPELHLSVKIQVVQAPKVEHDDVVTTPPSDNRMMLLQDSSFYSPKHVENLMVSIMNDVKEHENGVSEVGLRIGKHEEKLKKLDDDRAFIEQEICDLQALMEPQTLNQLDYLRSEKEAIMEQIEKRGGSAAAIFCNLSMAIQLQEPVEHWFQEQEVLGLVVLLGTVKSNDLSRIFAEYLGEDHLLAVVCKSYAAADALEKYEPNGKVDCNHALHAVANALRKPINGRFLVICLDNIRPYAGELVDNDPQNKLALLDPVLPTGEKPPPGFLGYAVNMIDLDIYHLHTRTASGHGLRETLFYLLFGELQVYATRELMKQAHTCIKHGAVSLDGGIMKGNGIVSLGCWDPDIRIPVSQPEFSQQLCPHNLEILKQIADKKMVLVMVREEIRNERKAHKKALKKFCKRKERYCKVIDEKGALLEDFPLDWKPINN